MKNLLRSGNTGDLLADADGSRVAVIDLTSNQEVVVSYADLNDQCNAVAGGLSARGLGLGDYIALASTNMAAFYSAFFGAMRAGCVPLQINRRLPLEAIRALLGEGKPKLVFADRGIAGELSDSYDVVAIGTEEFERFKSPTTKPSVRPDPNGTAFIPYSSGTTALPKGIMLSHRNSLWALRQMAEIIGESGLPETERVIIAHPLYHKNAMLGSKAMFMGGGCIVLQARFEEEAYLQAVERYRVTKLHTVPTMMARIVARDDLMKRYDLSSVTAVHMGSGPISDKLFDTVVERFPNAKVRISYGLTEAGPMQFGAHPEGKPTPRMSIGYPLADCELRFANGSTDEGVLQIRNPGVMQGYLNRPEETAKRLLADGWIDSGDILRRDADGFYYFVGRADDMFVVGGNNVYPAAIENVLLRDRRVEEACVVAVDDFIRGQVPHAFIVPKNGVQLTENQVKEFFLAHGPAYQHPRRVHIVKELPLQGTNKIDVTLLKKLAAKSVAKDTA